jgi:choline kinase
VTEEDPFTGLPDRAEFGSVEDNLHLYYEDVYSQLIEQGELRAEAADVSGLRWTEVDTLEDLETARRLFAAPGA